MKRGICRGCGAPIYWVKTKAGKSMPVNTTPVPFWAEAGARGKVVTADGAVVSCNLTGSRETISGFGYTSHFSTCPKAGTFRKNKH